MILGIAIEAAESPFTRFAAAERRSGADYCAAEWTDALVPEFKEVLFFRTCHPGRIIAPAPSPFKSF